MGEQVTRRGFLSSIAGVGGAVGASAATTTSAGTVAAQAETQRVSMTDGLVFDPETVYVAPGGTVIWQNVGSVGHSVTAYEDEIPADAGYFASGGFDSEQAARSAYPDQGDIAGEENYRHTFEVEGTYEYFCIPHESVGMVGTVEVTTEPPPADGGFESIVPDSAMTILAALLTVLVGVLGFTWMMMKYGGDYEGGSGEEP